MRRVTAIAVVFLMSFVGGTAWGACGDVDGNGSVTIADMVYLIVYIGGGGPTVPNLSDADVDGRTGISMSDLVALTNFIFGNGNTLNCSPSQSYTFSSSLADTVFFPRLLSIPDGLDTVDLEVITVLGNDVQGFYLPFLKSGAGTDKFVLSKAIRNPGIESITFPSTNPIPSWEDTITLVGADWDPIDFVGRQTMFTLRYGRTSAGAGGALPQLVDRSSLWKPSVEKNGDLFLPVIQYYDIIFLPETLKVTMSSLSFAGVAGYPSADSFVVNFTSSGLPITFELTATEPWITIVDTGAVGFRTPASVVIKADATSTGIGNYLAQIQFSNLSPPAPTTVAAIDASFAVRAPNIYPLGDLDCDGIVDISDLTKIIDHLFITMSPLTPCQP